MSNQYRVFSENDDDQVQELVTQLQALASSIRIHIPSKTRQNSDRSGIVDIHHIHPNSVVFACLSPAYEVIQQSSLQPPANAALEIPILSAGIDLRIRGWQPDCHLQSH